MKQHSHHPAPLADEQLLFTPEEMTGDTEATALQPASACSDNAEASGDNTPAPESSCDTPTAETESKDARSPEAENNETTLSDNSHAAGSTATHTPQQQPAPKADAPHSRHDNSTTTTTPRYDEGFTNEERIITEMTIALEFTDTLTLGKTRLIALEASVIWNNGVTPNGTYTINSLPQYTFDGYKFLALYYVTFYRAFPSMIEKLNLPYDRLYLLARRRYDGYQTKH